MQSSIWKLLTAAGIIGVGTLVVLEVQNRLPMRGAASNTAMVQTAGNELSVTPDSTTPFDEELAASSFSTTQIGPSQQDSSDPSAAKTDTADNQFYGAAVEQTVRKDDLTEDVNPFAASLTEPDDDPGSASGEQTSSESSASAIASETFPADASKTAVSPVSFQQETRETAQNAAEGDSVPVMELPADDERVIPFRSEELPASTTPKSATTPKNTAPDGKKILLFPNSTKTGEGNPMPATASGAIPGSNAATKPVNSAAAGQDSKETTSSVPAATNAFRSDEPPAAASTTKPAGPDTKSVQNTSGVLDETPSLFVPAPVPDVTRLAPAPSQSEDDSSLSPNPFEPDEEPALLPLSGTPDEDAATSPFPMDDSLEPIPEPLDPVVEPSPESPPLDRDLPSQDNDSGGALPFEPDSDLPDGDDSRPLPAAEEMPSPRERPGRERAPEGTDPVRTVSEVLRPQLTIQKNAPTTATVGVAHDYTIVVTNEGESSAYDVIVEDELGGAAEFLQSKPVAEYNKAADQLTWTFRELRAGEKKEIVVRIRPAGEGTLDGMATVRFKAQVKSATVITAPKLELQLSGPAEVKVGDEVQLTYSIRNNGSGDASNVLLRSVLPPGLKHPEGGDLEYEIENLRAGDTEDVELTVIAAEPGDLILVSAEVTSSGVSAAKAKAEIEVVGAQLTLERMGPERRYVGRSATYQNIVANESRFEAVNATVVEEVPEGLRFVSAGSGGVYNPDNRRIQWTIPKIAAGKQAVLEVELMAEEAGQMETIVEVTENAGFRTPLTENTIVTVEDLHNVTADISHQDEPVEVGERFGFTVTIDNRGTAVARNVEMSVQVPREIKVLAAGTRQVPGKLMAGNLVKYDRVLEIGPNEQMTFQLTLQGQAAVKNAAVEAFLKYDEMQKPLIVSESVTVYDDRP